MWRILTLALVFTIIVRMVRRRSRSQQLTGLGASPQQPILSHTYHQIDDHVSGLRCPCGGHVKTFGEGTEVHRGRELRVVRVRCENCEREHPIYFQLAH